MARKIRLLVVLFLVGVSGFAGYRVVRNGLSVGVYRDRLRQAYRDYDLLRTRYNTVVKKTAVAELVVEGGALSVQIRTVDGTASVIHTPYDPYDEIYLDYVVLDGRLWIRRVYDARTPPAEGLVVDPLLEQIDWEDLATSYGKAIYRRLGEGRWVVSVTGDGSLGLSRSTVDTSVDLSAAPRVRDYLELDEQARAAADRIGVGQVVRHLWGRAWAGSDE